MIEAVEQVQQVKDVDKAVHDEIAQANGVVAGPPQEQVIDDIVVINQPVEIDVANRTGRFGAVPDSIGLGARGRGKSQDRSEHRRADEFSKHATRVGRSAGPGQSFEDFVAGRAPSFCMLRRK